MKSSLFNMSMQFSLLKFHIVLIFALFLYSRSSMSLSDSTYSTLQKWSGLCFTGVWPLYEGTGVIKRCDMACFKLSSVTTFYCVAYFIGFCAFDIWNVCWTSKHSRFFSRRYFQHFPFQFLSTWYFWLRINILPFFKHISPHSKTLIKILVTIDLFSRN